MDKVVLQVNDIFSQAWKGCQKPMWFIIPSGYVYFTNEEGEIVSNKIRYTGKYIKL